MLDAQRDVTFLILLILHDKRHRLSITEITKIAKNVSVSNRSQPVSKSGIRCIDVTSPDQSDRAVARCFAVTSPKNKISNKMTHVATK